MKSLSVILLALSLAAPALSFAETSDASADMWNISTNPLGWVVGPNLTLDHKVADQWTVGVFGDVIWLNVGSLRMSGGGVGVQSTYYFDHAFQRGWFLNGGVNYSTLKAKYKEDSGREDSISLSQVSVPIIGGYKWFWGHFNLSLGIGPTISFRSTNEIKDQNGNDVKSLGGPVSVAGDASLGWTF